MAQINQIRGILWKYSPYFEIVPRLIYIYKMYYFGIKSTRTLFIGFSNPIIICDTTVLTFNI